MPPLNDKERANLVAYLDGELDAAPARVVEARLHRDPQARAEAVALRKTWELLDYLPRPEPSSHFTHRTLERISAQELKAHARREGARWWSGWGKGLGWAAAVLLAATAGFAAMKFFLPAGSDPGGGADKAQLRKMDADEIENHLVRNLRILENKPLYENVMEIEFLRDLDQADLFGDPDAIN